VNRTWRTETGEQREEVTFVDVDAFGRQAETIAQYMKKGSPLLVEGRLQLHTWEDKQTNQKQSKLRVTLENFRFVGSAQNRDAGGGGAVESAKSRPAEPPQEPVEEPPSDDDVPF
jgi:single-strand DNA-binding protein